MSNNESLDLVLPVTYIRRKTPYSFIFGNENSQTDDANPSEVCTSGDVTEEHVLSEESESNKNKMASRQEQPRKKRFKRHEDHESDDETNSKSFHQTTEQTTSVTSQTTEQTTSVTSQITEQTTNLTSTSAGDTVSGAAVCTDTSPSKPHLRKSRKKNIPDTKAEIKEGNCSASSRIVKKTGKDGTTSSALKQNPNMSECAANSPDLLRESKGKATTDPYAISPRRQTAVASLPPQSTPSQTYPEISRNVRKDEMNEVVSKLGVENQETEQLLYEVASDSGERQRSNLARSCFGDGRVTTSRLSTIIFGKRSTSPVKSPEKTTLKLDDRVTKIIPSSSGDLNTNLQANRASPTVLSEPEERNAVKKPVRHCRKRLEEHLEFAEVPETSQFQRTDLQSESSVVCSRGFVESTQIISEIFLSDETKKVKPPPKKKQISKNESKNHETTLLDDDSLWSSTRQFDN